MLLHYPTSLVLWYFWDNKVMNCCVFLAIVVLNDMDFNLINDVY